MYIVIIELSIVMHNMQTPKSINENYKNIIMPVLENFKSEHTGRKT